MEKTLRILIVEDSEDDAMLLLRHLQHDGYQPDYRRVDSAEGVKSALDQQSWDMVISDYILPDFGGLEVLRLIQSKGLDIPCIIVSGRITDETAVAAMKAGARDYIMKDNLKRIGAAIERELLETVARRERRKAQDQLKEVSEKLYLVTETIQDIFWMSSPRDGEIAYLSPAFEQIWGRSRVEFPRLPQSLYDTVHPEDHRRFMDACRKHAEGEAYFADYRILRPDGSVRWIHDRGYPIYSNTGQVEMMTGVARDVTPQKMAEENLKKVNRAREVLIKVNEALIRSTSENELLHMVCRIIVEEGGYRMSWAGYVEQSERKWVLPVAHAGFEDGYLEKIQVTWADTENGRGPAGIAVRTGKPCVSKDIQNDPAFLAWREPALKRGYASVISLPMIENGRAFGVLNIYASEPYRFDADESQLLSWLASDLSFGILALRTRVERDDAESSLRGMANRLVELQEEERRKIARELHDQVGQSLTGLKLMINQAMRSSGENSTSVLNEAQLVVTELMQQVREMSLTLRPSMLDDLGLLPTLLWHMERYTNQTGIKVNFEHHELQATFSQDISTAVYRVIQEALTNVARYAGVNEVNVQISVNTNTIHLAVEDQGSGFDLSLLSKKATAGISGMRERTQLLGGSLRIETSPGKGTCLLAELPLPGSETQPDNTT